MGVGGHSKGQNDLSAHDGQPTSTLEAAVVRISDRVAYLNHDLDDALRSGMIQAVPPQFSDLGSSHSERIGRMVQDIIEQSLNRPAISISARVLEHMNALKDWLFANVYHQYPVRYPDVIKAQGMVRELYAYYVTLGSLPPGFEGSQGAVDYVSGMTDRFAVEAYAKIKLPSSWRTPV